MSPQICGGCGHAPHADACAVKGCRCEVVRAGVFPPPYRHQLDWRGFAWLTWPLWLAALVGAGLVKLAWGLFS